MFSKLRVKGLLKKINSPNLGKSSAASKALSKCTDPCAVEPLIQALETNTDMALNSIIKALGNISDPRAVEPLIRIITDKKRISIRE